MKKYLFPIMVGLMLLFACNKDEEEPTPPPPTNYQPISAGSYWTYSGFDGGPSFNVTMTGTTDTLSGLPYVEFSHSLYGTGGFRKEGGVYYNLFDFSGSIVEFPYMKDNEPVLHTWDYIATFNGTNTRLRYTILERDVDKVVFGRLFRDVIVVQTDTYYDLGGGFDSVFVTTESWYANDIGLIFSDISDQGMTFLEFYEIK